MDLQDPEERTVPRDQRVARGSRETPALWEQAVRRANSACPGCQDTPGDKAPRDLKVSKVSQAPMERKELGEQRGRPAHADRGDRRALEERGDREDRRGKPDQRVPQEMTARQDRPGRGVCRGLRDQRVSLDQRDLLDLQGKTDCLDIPDREERLDSKARPAPLALPAWLDLRDQTARLDRWGIEVTLDPRARLVSRVFQELQGKKEPRVTQVLLARQVRMALRAQEDSREREVFLAPWGLTA